MLSKYGEVYQAIDRKYHPNPGSADEGFPEIERVVDWMYLHKFSIVKDLLDQWVKIDTAKVLKDLNEGQEVNEAEVVNEVFYSDIYEPCKESVNSVVLSLEYFKENPSEVDKYSSIDIFPISDKIVSFLNEKFLRVRLGGKLNSTGEDAIYFRISSHGFDWKRVIVNFLWDEFGSPEKMPRRVWVGHDEENNPPEVVLFDGSPEDLLEGTSTVLFEKINRVTTGMINLDKKSTMLNSYFDSLIGKSFVERRLI